MFAAGAGAAPPNFSGGINSQVVRNVDPENPTVAGVQEQDAKADFMRLLIEQLRNQDPMSPMSNSEMTAQITSMNSLEQLVSINALMEQSLYTNSLLEGTAMIGKYVEGLDANNNMITGIVEQAELVDGMAMLKVGDGVLLMNQITLVGAPEFMPVESSDDSSSEGGGDA